MPDKKTPYHESLLHWVWEYRHIELSQLKTRSGQPLAVLKPGVPNPSDGPDFLQAEIRIGSMKWFGDVEIHWRENDWNLHRHHEDPNFNRVILHIVYHQGDQAGKPALRQDQTYIHTLHLKPYVTEPLQSFLNRYNQPGALPCSGHFSYISEEAFLRQLETARKLYFEQKVDDLLHLYDSGLPPSRAWINMLATGLWDGLGISHNRIPMQKLCRKMISHLPEVSSCSELIERAISLSGIKTPGAPSPFGWKHKSSRPANHPNIRIRQATECLWHINLLPFDQWLKSDISELWQQLVTRVQTQPGLGRGRAGILYGTVWLPSFFILGNLFGSERLTSAAYNNWLTHQVQIPPSVIKPFTSLGISADSYRDDLGAVYQLRSHCQPRKCEGCEVFKSIISS